MSGNRLAIMPSIVENRPNTVVECAAHGIPFLASNVGAIPEIVSERAHWLGPPPYTKLEQLHGKVVWLQFNF